jgi:hypothetical protein
MAKEPQKKTPASLVKAARAGKPVAVAFESMATADRAKWRARGGVCKGPGSTPGTIRICPRDPVTGECKGVGCYEIPDPDFEKPAAAAKSKPAAKSKRRAR